MGKVILNSVDNTISVTGPEPISPEHQLDAFDCGQPALNDWLKKRARVGEGRASRTFVLARNGDVVAYYCLAAGSIEREQAPGKLRRNAPDPIPVILLGRFAVCRTCQGTGLGSDLLRDAFIRTVQAAEIVGAAALLVHAKDDAASRFYRGRAEFIPYPATSRILFLPIETIRAGM